MKRILLIVSFIGVICCNLRAQITLNPSVLTWAADETGSKVVIVHSGGHWETDSTSFNTHFSISRYDGYDGTEIEISPLGPNTSGTPIMEEAEFRQGIHRFYLQLVQLNIQASITVTPSNLSWSATDTGNKSLSITCPGSWSVSCHGNHFYVSPSSGTGNATIFIHPSSTNYTAVPRTATLNVSDGLISRQISLTQAGTDNPSESFGINPSALIWEYDEYDTKSIQINCIGHWESDSTRNNPHFCISKHNGAGNTLIAVTPSGNNTAPYSVADSVEFRDDFGHVGMLTLLHKSFRDVLSVSPSSLRWACYDTLQRTVRINTSKSWTAVIHGAGFETVSASGTGNADICVKPSGTNISANPIEAILEISGDGIISRSVLLSQDGCESLEPSLGNDTIPNGNPGASIPYERTITPTGAVMYSIPIMVDPSSKFSPSLAMTYNSQSGNGLPGYGWSIAGLPVIAQIPQSRHYHGKQAAAVVSSQDGRYALDGIPFMEAEGCATGETSFPYETVRGHIRVAEASDGFDALYPDGSRAHFGTCAPGEDAFYPITEFEDRFGRRIEISYLHDGGFYYPHTITYNLQETNPGLLSFSYVDRTDALSGFYAGIPVRQGKLLTGIVSSDGSEELRTYTLHHAVRAGVNILTAIQCSVGGNGITPLRFEYGEDVVLPTEIFIADTPRVVSNGIQDDSDGNFLLRGKFSVLYYEDGVLSVPQYPNYVSQNVYLGWDGSTTLTKCKSGYPSDAKIFLTPIISQADTFSIYVGENFQDVQVVDVDNNGLDEIIKVNYIESGFNQDRTGLRLGIYKYNETTHSTERTDSSMAFISGSVMENHGNDTIYSPRQRLYRYGCFTQGGHIQLLAVSYSRDMLGREMPANTALVDVTTGVVLYDDILLSVPYGEDYRLFVADMDSDGISEICYATEYGLQLYSYASGSITLERTCSGITSAELSEGVSATDINADGYIDLICRNPLLSLWNAFIFDGTSFSKKIWDVGNGGSNADIVFMDINSDGLPDAVCVDRTTGQINYGINHEGSLASGLKDSGLAVQPGYAPVPVNLMGYNIASTLTLEKEGRLLPLSFSRDFRESLLMTGMKDSYLNVSRYTYGDVAEVGNAYGNDTENIGIGEWYVERSFPLRIVSTVKAISDGNTIDYRTYEYNDAIVANDGYGFICFAKIHETDKIRNRHKDIYYDPSTLGSPVIIKEYLNSANGTPVSFVENMMNPSVNPFGKPVDAKLVMRTSTDNVAGIIEIDNYSYDAWGLLSASSTNRRVGNEASQTSSSLISYSHSLADSLYVLGAISEKIEYSDLDGNTSTMTGARDSTEYDAWLRPVKIRKYKGILNGSSVQWGLLLEQQWQYDSYGNITRERTAAYGATTFNETTYTYGASGRNLTSVTDALDRTVTYSGYDKYGNPSVMTDWLGRSTEYVYDAWGNLIQTTLPNGMVQSTAISWNSGDEPGIICVTNTATGRPTTKVWSDALGREIRGANLRFDGSWQYSDIEYDSRGRLLRRCLPYRDTSTGPLLWDTYTYDEYDRPICLSEASGNQTTWEYNGTSTTTTIDGICSTSTTDASGNVVRVSDPGGTISYSLRDDARPSSVTVTPTGSSQGVLTTFSYDTLGRRTAIVDPSIGMRTTLYSDNLDGTSSVASTGPKGTVTTHYDRHGRITSVTRPEFNTSFTYGTSSDSSSYGKLLSETSTNGTGRTYTYDDLGRVLTETEQADDAHWLRKTFSYGIAGNVVSVGYMTQDGIITTESFEYTNGHNTAVTIPEGNGTTVWRMTAENSLGQPTAMTTGTAHRNYAFTITGIPQNRVARSAANVIVQDLSYSYDNAFGNMVWRQDNVSGYRETLSYDEHSRLLSSLQTFTSGTHPELDYSHVNMSYSSNGNVTCRDNDGILDLLLEYNDATDPYRVTGNHMEGGFPAYVPEYGHIVMTSFDRPDGIGSPESGASTLFTYNATGNRTKMSRDEDAFSIHMDRYYLGGVYEKDHWRDGIRYDSERLFLGGTAYDAPMVLVKEQSVNGGTWTPFNILRDVQGSITEVTSADGETVVESFRYDPWGLRTVLDGILRDSLGVDFPGMIEENVAAEDSTVAIPGWQMAGQSIYVGGHGYTGHEHLPGWGVINMNARIYDPALCRFLSPDPRLQDPANTQNFNRYSYCLNNPLKYSDPTGEIVWLIPAAIIIGTGFINYAINSGHCNNVSQGLYYFGVGCASAALAVLGGPAGIFGSGVLLGGGNSLVSQGITNGFQNIDWLNIAGSAMFGGATSFISSSVGNFISSISGNWISSINNITLRETLSGATGGTITGAISGGINDFNGVAGTFWENVGRGAAWGALEGSLGGFAKGRIKERQRNNQRSQSNFYVEKSRLPDDAEWSSMGPSQKGEFGVQSKLSDLRTMFPNTDFYREVSFKINGTTYRADVSYMDGSNRLHIVEVKSGVILSFTKNQKITIPALQNGGNISIVPFGSKAADMFNGSIPSQVGYYSFDLYWIKK